VDITERGQDSMLATFHVQVKVGGMDVNTDYTVRYKLSENEVSWSLVHSPTLTKHDGMWRIEATPDGETRAHYENEIVTTLAIPEELQKIFADQELPRMMQRFRDRAEA